MIDLNRARQETPGCQHVTHFNNAGAALMPQPVLVATLDHLHREARSGGYEAADKMAAELTEFYEVTAGLLNSHPDEIAFVENATRAWDMSRAWVAN
jgi:cysteine desulfurase / selenocysteine lyase